MKKTDKGNPKDVTDKKATNVTRRAALVGMAGAAGTVLARTASGQDVQVSSAPRLRVPPDPTKTVGRLASEFGERSPFEPGEAAIHEAHRFYLPSDCIIGLAPLLFA